MPNNQLIKSIKLASEHLGMPQQSGVMTVLPLFFESNFEGRFASPFSGLKLSQVYTYGKLELYNTSQSEEVIVPLHMGYIQDQAQNHALCRSAFLSPGQKLVFEDACCVQESQGGYLEGADQWFFVLPLQLRLKALELRGINNYSKLWDAISNLNRDFGLANRGHLEQIIVQRRAFLNTYQNRFELLPGQRGAIFLINDRFVGLEIAPTASYFADIWMPLVCFCYGVAAMYEEENTGISKLNTSTLNGSNLAQIREKLLESRKKKQEKINHEVVNSLQSILNDENNLTEEERFLSLRLHTLMGQNLAGQFVEEEGKLVYASLFATPKYFSAQS